MKTIVLLTLVFLLNINPTAYAQSPSDNFEMIATICYAATDMLKKDTGFLSEYSLMNSHLGATALPKLGLSHDTAKTKGKSEILGGARKLGISPYETSLMFYNKICKPVFIQ